MGLYDREYYRDEDQPRGFSPGGQRMLVTNIVLITVAIYLIDAFTSPQQQGGEIYGRWLSGALALQADLFARPWNFWQLLTYGFVHAPLGSRFGLMHIGMNMFILWMFGRELEEKYGRREFLCFYLFGIVAAGLAWVVIRNVFHEPVGSVIGASGAVTAVFILFVLHDPRRTLYIWGLIAAPAWLLGALYIAFDILGAATGRGQVAYEAHLAGAVFALAYYRFGWSLSRLAPLHWPAAPWRTPTKWLKPKPKLKVHDPEEYYHDLDAQADRILAKLHHQGESSLTPHERRILEDYSRRMRQKHR